MRGNILALLLIAVGGIVWYLGISTHYKNVHAALRNG